MAHDFTDEEISMECEEEEEEGDGDSQQHLINDGNDEVRVYLASKLSVGNSDLIALK